MVLSVLMPALVVDLLLAANLAAAVVMLMVALVTPRPVELSSFPSVVVLTSLARILLCLVVARLIVTTGQAGGLATTLAAVTGLNNPVASLGTLITVGVVQFVMVTAGVSRLAEVAARFALDALPGKQLALDSAISAQGLSASESHQETSRLEAEANFYGAMDGAARFLRGETIATVAIVVITPVVRLLTAGLPDGAWPQLALLTAGHGLIILLPALLMGAAAAIMVARAGSASALTTERGGQLVRTPGLLVAAAAACLLLALVPGMAELPLLAVAVGLGVWGGLLIRSQAQRAEAEGVKQVAPETSIPSAATIAPQIHLGWGLLDLLADGGEQLLSELTGLRQQMSAELGFRVPAFVVRDSATLGLHDYSFVFRSSTVDGGQVWPTRRLAVANEPGIVPSPAIPTTFADGRPAAWVTPQQEEEARNSGCELLSAQEAILRHLRRTLRQYAAELFDTQRAAEMLASLTRTHPATVAEARAAGLTVTLLAAVGQELLKKGLPIADHISLVETIAEGLATTTDSAQLATRARRAMQRTITQLLAPGGTLYALQLAPEIEDALAGSETEPVVLTPEQAANWRQLLGDLTAEYRRTEQPIALLCSSAVRPALEQLAAGFVPDLLVVGPEEVLGETEIQWLYQITSDDVPLVVGPGG